MRNISQFFSMVFHEISGTLGRVRAFLVDSTGTELKGQKASTSSIPVVIASDQPAIPVSAEISLTTNNVEIVDSAGNAIMGQEAMTSSLPVVIASDQSAIPVTGTFYPATQPISETYTGISNGKYTIAVTNAVESIVAVSTPCKKVILRAASANANNIYYGGAAVALDGTNSDFLEPGSWVEIPIENLNLIRVRGTITEVVAFTFVS